MSAAAPTMGLLIAGRTLQGIGGGGIVPLTQTTIADMITPRERGHYQAYMGTSWIVAGVAGPALGGLIAEYLHWSMIFWLNVPFGLLAALLTGIDLDAQAERLSGGERRRVAHESRIIARCAGLCASRDLNGLDAAVPTHRGAAA